MKKIIISLIAASIFIFTGCFADSDTATVRINLGNLPVAKTAKVEKKSLIDRFLMFFAKEAVAQPSDVSVIHLGAFDANNQLLAKKNVTAMLYGEPVPVNTVEFDVPARSGVRIVVLGEQETIGGPAPTDIATWYGCSKPRNLTAGATEEVEVKMEELFSLFGFHNNKFNFRYDEEHPDHNPSDIPFPSVAIKWDRIYGVSRYILGYAWNQENPGNYINIHDGSNENCINDIFNPAAGTMYRIKLEFKFAGINSEQILFGMDSP